MTNARFEDLEKRVKKIKLKKYMKFSFIFIVVIALSCYIVMQNISKVEVVQKQLHVKKTIKPKEKKVVKVEKKIEPVKKKLTYDTIKLKVNISVPNIVEVPTVEVKKVVVKEKLTIKRKINLRVKEVKSEDALLQRFKVAGDFESASSLAKLYFKKKKFERSIYWSKKASKLEAKEASSWIIYAKAKYEMGSKDEAIKSLELYLDYFSSDEITKLLKLYRSSK